MPILPTIAVRAAAKASTWAPMRNLLAGAAAYLTRHYNDQAAEPALEIWSSSATGTAPVLWVRDDLNGEKLIEVNQNGVTLRSPDGSKTVVVGNGGVATEGALTGLRDYSVADHGLVEGSSGTNAAANTSALQNLWAQVAADGGGRIVVPPGEWPLNATVLDHHLGYGVSISIAGATGGSSLLKLYGTTGPFLDISPSSTSTLFQCGISDLRILHANTVTSGATVRLGATSRYSIDRVLMDGNGPFIGLQMILGASVHCHDTTITARNVTNAVCVDCAQSVGTGGIQFTNCDLSGDPNVAVGSRVTRGLRFNHSSLIDTVVLNNTSIKDHLFAINAGLGGGSVANFQMTAGYLDASQYDVVIDPLPGAAYYGWFFTNVWMAGTVQNVLLNTSNGGTITNFHFLGGYMTDATQGAVYVEKNVNLLAVQGVRISAGTTNNASYAAVKFVTTGGTSPLNVAVNGNYIQAGAAAAACIQLPSGSTPINVTGNLLRGSADADGVLDAGATSASRVIANNSWAV